MQKGLDLKNAVGKIISSYENRIQNLDSIFDVTYQFLSQAQESLVNARDEREKVNTQIRDILARNEHLRKKDFDSMMQEILLIQEQREKDIRNILKEYFNEQKEIAQTLRENLEKFRDCLAKGEVQRVKEFQALIKDILSRQEKSKKDIVSKLEDFQKEQHELAIGLKELLAKGNNLRIRDFKLMLKRFKAQHRERLALRDKRRENVAKMLADFEKARREARSSRAIDIDAQSL